MPNNGEMIDYIPDSSEAEEWLTPDIFLAKGHYFRITLHGQVVPVSEGQIQEIIVSKEEE